MPTYPFTPELLDALPEELAELFRGLEAKLLEEICSRLKIADNLNEVTIQDIKALRSHGISLEKIKKAIADTSNVSIDKVNKLLDNVVVRNQAYYTEVINATGITSPERLIDEMDIDAIRRQTVDEFKNITQSMGFIVDKGCTMLPPAKAYQWALDSAALQIQSGAISYNQAIREQVKQLAESGLKTVPYESGHVDQVEVAVRRAVMTGVAQLCDKYTEQSMNFLNTPYCEISAHRGARDITQPNVWSSHKSWQGKVYYQSRNGEPDPLGKYPDLVAMTGFGYVDGLNGANCRHKRYAWVEGVSERTYTDAELKNIDLPPFEYEGRTYTAYEATQMQRKLERTIRKQKRLKTAYESAGLKEEARSANIRLRRLNEKYRAFSKAADLPEQQERLKVEYIDDASMKKATALKVRQDAEDTKLLLKNSAGHAIIEVKKTTNIAEPNMITQRINAKGGIDRNFYGANGRQTLQISNNGHGHKAEEALGVHGEHAHDYFWDKDGNMTRGTARELTEEERRDNDDFL